MIFLMVQGVKTNVKQLIKRVSKIQVSTIDKSVENQEENKKKGENQIRLTVREFY